MDNQFDKKLLKKKSENVADWYTDVILKAELADYGPARGTMVIRPYGYSIWERTQKIMDGWFKEYGVQNAYFPMFIPMHLLQKEKEHIEGFSPELAVVTHGGGEELTEPLAVRPTSETIMYEMYKKWINSWRDLPYLINQWNNAVRWELRTYLFLRTSEFLWQEGHTVHEDEGGAMEMVLQAQEWYRKIYEEYFAIPVIAGIKSEKEKFAGAKATYGVELLMPDGKALQGATSHNLGQNFSKSFNVTFQDREGKSQYAWQTSWGFSTRSLGGLFLTHGDDHGVIIPPKIAPIQAVIIAFPSKEKQPDLEIYTQNIFEELNQKGIRTHWDKREGWSAGRKFNEWEIKGVPLRLEIGEREMTENKVSVARRDTLEKFELGRDGLADDIFKYLDTVQQSLYQKASQYLQENTHEVESYDKFKEIMSGARGYIKAFWCEEPACEAKIKEETKATTRVRVLGQEEQNGKCIICGKEAKFVWHFAQAY